MQPLSFMIVINQNHCRFSQKTSIPKGDHPCVLVDNRPVFKDYTDDRNNRFLTAKLANKNRILPPTEVWDNLSEAWWLMQNEYFQILHYFNAPPGLTEIQLRKMFDSKDIKPTVVHLLGTKNGKSSSGWIGFGNKADAVLAIMKYNHRPIMGGGI